MRETPLMSTICERQLAWLNHFLRRKENEPVHIFALYEPWDVKAVRGRPLTFYFNYITILLGLSAKLTTPTNISELARDRDNWSALSFNLSATQ